MTRSMENALKWFADHGGDGVRQGRGRVQILAGGEIAPFYWMTFKSLISAGHIEEYGNYRLRLVK